MAPRRRALGGSLPQGDDDSIRVDNIQNVLTGLGTARDKRVFNTFVDKRYSADELETAYRNNDMIARIVDDVPAEMFREGWEFTSDVENSTEIATKIASIADELNFDAYAEEAAGWARLFGGAAIVAGLDDGRQPHEPLDLNTLKGVRWLNVMVGPELIPDRWQEDPSQANHGRVETFRMYPRSHAKRQRGSGYGTVHASRMILFDGARVTNKQRRINQGWGDPVPQRCLDVVLDFCSAYGGAASLLQDFAQGVFAIKGLSALLAAGKEDQVRKRLEVIDMARSIIRSALIDADGETFERKTTNVAGLDALLIRLEHRLAAAADMPVSRIMGQSPGGLANADQGQARWWYDRIAAKQTKELRPRINQFVKWLLLSKEGPTKGIEPENWKVEFRPLQQLTEKERADIRLVDAQADQIHWTIGALDPEEIADSAYGGGEYSSARKLNRSLRESYQLSFTDPLFKERSAAKEATPPAGVTPSVEPEQPPATDGT